MDGFISSSGTVLSKSVGADIFALFPVPCFLLQGKSLSLLPVSILSVGLFLKNILYQIEEVHLFFYLSIWKIITECWVLLNHFS
jgi:hypothetical protein